jgi:hypothetical protein
MGGGNVLHSPFGICDLGLYWSIVRLDNGHGFSSHLPLLSFRDGWLIYPTLPSALAYIIQGPESEWVSTVSHSRTGVQGGGVK